MFSSKLSAPLYFADGISHEEIIDSLYVHFKNNIMDKESRGQLFDKFIFIDCKKWIYHKSELFWHLISLNQSESFNVLPCNNCLAGSICPDNCLSPLNQMTLSNGEVRNICYYRGIRINWISDIIKLANEGDPCVQHWTEPQPRGNNKLYLRFSHQAADYALVFEEKFKNGVLSHYQLITSFPVFYINKKQQMNSRYHEYQEMLKTPK